MTYTLDDVITIGPKEQVFSRFLLGDIIIISLSTLKDQYYYAKIENSASVFEPDPVISSLVLPEFDALGDYYEKIFDEDMQTNMNYQIDYCYVWPCTLDTFKKLYQQWEKDNK